MSACDVPVTQPVAIFRVNSNAMLMQTQPGDLHQAGQDKLLLSPVAHKPDMENHTSFCIFKGRYIIVPSHISVSDINLT